MYTLLLHLASTSEFYTLSLHDALPICSVVSEYPPGTTPARHRFLVRNRLIAAFGAGTVVVEAGRRSGALSTAAHARRLGRPVMAVPGPVTSAMSLGCHDLLRREWADDGPPTRLVTCASDVLGEISATPGAAEGAVAEDELMARSGAGHAQSIGFQRELDALTPAQGAVYDALRPRAWCTE